MTYARLVDGAVCASATVASLLALEQNHSSGLLPAYAASVLVAGVAAASLLLRRRAPGLVMALALLSTLSSADPTLLIFAAYALGAYGDQGRWAGTGPALMVAGASAVYVCTRSWVDPAQLELSEIAYETFVALCFPAAVGDLMRRRRVVTRLLRRRLVAAERAVDQAAEQAVLEERTRLAFDIHDGLGYQATVLRLHAEALRNAPGIPDSAAVLAATVEEAAGGVQRDLRALLDVLGGGDGERARGGPPYAQFAAALVSNLRAAGVDVSHRRTGEPYPLPTGVDDVLRNCGREALTNAVKHGHGAPVSLHLDFGARAVTLEVGHGPSAVGSVGSVGSMGSGRAGRARRAGRRRGEGIGLASMRERVARAGGRIEAGGTEDGGFRLRVELPVELAGPEVGAGTGVGTTR
ncbi:sensor histidine kinase [Streptomyces sp. NPDC051555]|uniref:sensor histidine kinase n=1 Tax=Streptomyces sp. NPDC051555 TaxID=3365657 RepID=UPI0037B7982C